MMLIFIAGPLHAKIMKKIETVQPSTQVTPERPVQPAPVVRPVIQPIAPVRPTQPLPQLVQPLPQLPVQPIIQKPLPPIPQMRQPEVRYYLVPTDEQTLRQFGLYPLFGKNGGRYAMFNPDARLFSGETEPRFEYKDVAQNAPCIVRLGRLGSWSRIIMQLNSLDQFALADATGLDPALCAGHSINNGRLMRDYVLTGNRQNLRDLHDIQRSANFLLDLNIGAWLNVEVVREKIAGLRQQFGVDGIDVSAVSSVSLFDANLDKKAGFAVFDQAEFEYAQKVKQNIRQGLQQDNYVHVMIIGNEETVEKDMGHYFCFVIAKAGNEIQYIVLDTSPMAYHLQARSHEMDRLLFVIQNIEQGYSAINVANIRTYRLHMLEEERKASLR
jgi:hypothetical protein